jgi:hypothetical protein
MKLKTAVRDFVRTLGRTKILVSSVLALSSIVATAQGNMLVGQWRGTFQSITLTIVIQPNGQYIQTAQKGTMMTQQSGPYKLVAPDTIIFSVSEWAPKTQQIYHPTGTVGGYYTPQNTPKPPGATDTYVFSGPNTVVLTDQTTHGAIKMVRTQ